jgi:hypothetical protein
MSFFSSSFSYRSFSALKIDWRSLV